MPYLPRHCLRLLRKLLLSKEKKLKFQNRKARESSYFFSFLSYWQISFRFFILHIILPFLQRKYHWFLWICLDHSAEKVSGQLPFIIKPMKFSFYIVLDSGNTLFYPFFFSELKFLYCTSFLAFVLFSPHEPERLL